MMGLLLFFISVLFNFRGIIMKKTTLNQCGIFDSLSLPCIKQALLLL